MSKPDLILITGAPGSGKSTLARKLSESLYSYSHIDIDDVLQSFWEKSNEDPEYDREMVGIPKAREVIEYLLKADIRLIVDVQFDEAWIKKITKQYELLNIHCTAENAAERFYERELLEDGSEPDWLGEHMPEIKGLEEAARDPIDIGQKIIRVDTTDEYEPSIKQITKEIES